MDHVLDRQEVEALLCDAFDAGEDATPSGAVEPLLRLLDDVRAEVVQPIPDDVADAHLARMLAVVPAPARLAVTTRRYAERLRRYGRSRRVAVAALCAGAAFSYGGLAAAGALPAPAAVIAHVRHALSGHGPAHTPTSAPAPNTDTAQPPSATGHPSAPQHGRSSPSGDAVTGSNAGETPQHGPPAVAPSTPASTPRGKASGQSNSTSPATPAKGSSASAPGHTGSTPANSSNGKSSNAPGHTTATTTATSNGKNSNAPGHTTATTTATSNGKSSNAPGHTTPTSSPSANSNGKSANAPTHA